MAGGVCDYSCGSPSKPFVRMSPGAPPSVGSTGDSCWSTTSSVVGAGPGASLVGPSWFSAMRARLPVRLGANRAVSQRGVLGLRERWGRERGGHDDEPEGQEPQSEGERGVGERLTQ